jgi:hypothetical protein
MTNSTEPHLAADLAVSLHEDRPGVLARAITCVSAAGINIDGYSEMNGVVHVLAPDLNAARVCLIDAGFRIIQQQQVAIIPVADEPGAAARVFQKVADAHINVRYSYLATRNRLVIAAEDPQAVVNAVSQPR